jgi:hypothetical protein
MFQMITFKIMADSKDNQKNQEQASASSAPDKTETSQQDANKKERLKFRKEDMYEITYNF